MSPNSLVSMSRGKFKTSFALVALLVLFSMLLVACGGPATSTPGTSGTPGSGAKKAIFNLGAHVGAPYAKAYSPFNPNANEGVRGFVYEPLYFINQIDGKETPLLASSYKWSEDFSQLTFTTRQNVKWQDGKPFTAEDVAFTYNLLKEFPGADSAGVWVFLKSVEASDPSTVVMTFSKPYPPAFWYVAGQTTIVPKHLFDGKGDPTSFENDPLVGTGPFKLKSLSPQLIVYEKNPDYWQAEKVKIDELRLPQVTDNNVLLQKLIAGEIDWGGFFADGLDQSFVAKDPANNHYWMAPYATFSMYINLTKAPLNDAKLRQAMSLALDRPQFSIQAESGYVEAGSPTALVLPNQKDFLDPAYASLSRDVAQANKLLDDAGYTKGSDGIRTKDGNKLSFKLNVVTGWTDWEKMCQIVKQNLQEVGIDIVINGITNEARTDGLNNGTYDLSLGGTFSGPSPFYQYNTHLNSSNIGGTKQNWSRWDDENTDKLLEQYATTVDKEVQKQAILGLQKVMVENVPFIPLVNAGAWFEYSTKNFTGWPDANNPYALGATWSFPDNLMIVTSVAPK